MSIRRYCDGCGDEIVRNAVTERIEGSHEARSGCAVQVSVMVGVGSGHINNGDLCVVCVLDAVTGVAGHALLAPPAFAACTICGEQVGWMPTKTTTSGYLPTHVEADHVPEVADPAFKVKVDA